MRLQKPEVKAPQSKVVSYGTSFLLVAKGPNVVSTYSENQKPFATLGSQKVAVDARSAPYPKPDMDLRFSNFLLVE